MAWILNSSQPIYTQLIERIQKQIVSGYYKPGDKLPSVRELANEASVNPNTMQKAFSELERSNLIITQRTNGRFVTEDITLIREVQEKLMHSNLFLFLQTMKELGYTKEEVITALTNINMEEK